MAKRREPNPTWRSTKSRYYAKPFSGQTVHAVQALFDKALVTLNDTTGLTFLDQTYITKQTAYNLAMVWLATEVETKGAKALMKELGRR